MGAGKIVQAVGVVVALIAGVIGEFAYSTLIITILGIAGGIFIVKEDRMPFLVATIALIAASVQESLTPIPIAGEYINGAMGGLAALFSAGALVVILVGTWERVQPTS